MKLSDTVFNSCAELAALMEPVSPAMAVLQLSPGPTQGRLRVYGLGNFRVSVLETSQTLFLSGQRRSDRLTLAFELGRTCDLSKLRAQGAAMPWPGFLGFNQELTDFDLRLPAGSQLTTLLLPKALLQDNPRATQGTLVSQRLQQCNLLELKAQQRRDLATWLNALSNNATDQPPEPIAEGLLDVSLTALAEPTAQTALNQPRQERHSAALKVLHRCMANPKDLISSDALSEELAVSRSALFKGCQEHFGLTPTQLQRSIRLDRVRTELLQGKGSIGAIAAEFGFQSRSHFARRYREQFAELPQTTADVSQL